MHPVEGGAEPDEPFAEGATSDSVEGALETAYSEGLFISLPDVDLAAAKVEGDRVLLTFAPASRPVVALVFRDGPATEGAGGPGWYLESWARCDFADFPEQVAADFGYLLWRDAAGEPVPVRQVSSGPGAEHCGYDVMTFLYLRGGRDVYVRAPNRFVRDLVDEYRRRRPAAGRRRRHRLPARGPAAVGVAGPALRLRRPTRLGGGVAAVRRRPAA